MNAADQQRRLTVCGECLDELPTIVLRSGELRFDLPFLSGLQDFFEELIVIVIVVKLLRSSSLDAGR